MALRVDNIEKLNEFSSVCDLVENKIIDSITIMEYDEFKHYKDSNGRSKYPSTSNIIRVVFDDSSELRLFDGDQQCCEYRYATSDDVGKYSPTGAKLKHIVIGHCTWAENEYGGTNEIQFVRIETSGVSFDFEIHNEHNGYYSGFDIQIEYIPAGN